MEIQNKLVKILNTVLSLAYDNDEYEVLLHGLDFDTNIVEEFDLGSLDIMEFNTLIQDEFDVDIEDDNLLTINSIAACIEHARGAHF